MPKISSYNLLDINLQQELMLVLCGMLLNKLLSVLGIGELEIE